MFSFNDRVQSVIIYSLFNVLVCHYLMIEKPEIGGTSESLSLIAH